MSDKLTITRQATMAEVERFEETHDAIMDDIYASIQKHLGTKDNLAFILVFPGMSGAAIASEIEQPIVISILRHLGGGTIAPATRKT